MAIDMDMVSVRTQALAHLNGAHVSGVDDWLSAADKVARWISVGEVPGVNPVPTASVPRKLGRLPPKPGMRARVPHLSEIAPSLPAAPARDTSYVDAVPSWILGENDRIGDCTCVGPANVILALTSLAAGGNLRAKRLDDATIVGFYAALTGYTPDDPASDNGAVIEDVLTAWRTKGIGGDRLDGFASITPSDHQRVTQAIAYLGPVDLGVTLPNGWMQATTWDVSTAGTGIAGGHCITAVGYTSEGPLIVSWGQVFTLTWSGWDQYVDEAHVLLSRDALTAAGKSPDGVDWTALEARMQAMETA